MKGREISKGFWLRAGLFLCLFMMVIVAGCSSGSKNSAMDSSSSAGSANQATSTRSSAEMADVVPTADDSGSVAYALSSSNMGNSDASAAGISDSSVAAGFNLKMIYNANVVMEVDDYAAAQAEVRNLVMLSKGYILEFSDSQTSYERGGYFTVKVPAGGFMSFIDALQQMQTVKPPQLSMQGRDVTEEYVDLESRLRAMQVTEERLLSFMEKATGTDDLVRFTQELARVQENIEQIKGRMRYLDQNVAFSTVEIRIYEKLAENPKKLSDASVWDRALHGVKGSLQFLQSFFAELFIFLFAALPIIVVLGIIGSVGYFIFKRAQRQPRQLNQDIIKHKDPKIDENIDDQNT